MNITENLNQWGKHYKKHTMNKQNSVKHHHQPTIVSCFRIIRDKIWQVLLSSDPTYGNNLVCIFMNVNENLEFKEKNEQK